MGNDTTNQDNTYQEAEPNNLVLPLLIGTVSVGVSILILVLTIRYLWNAGAPKTK